VKLSIYLNLEQPKHKQLTFSIPNLLGILAFSMAVSELPVLESESSFATTFMKICQATLSLDPCTPPAVRGSESSNNGDDELLLAATQCQAATLIQELRVMKLGTPHYNDSGKQLLLDHPSKAIWSLS
jgi:hypothetical protein